MVPLDVEATYEETCGSLRIGDRADPSPRRP